ncbi:CMGC/DYRK protein kinase [Pochonia chlamydosporia 170]|uniref:CMGC/DYRK protein kinase n=1 Tax=Pochonia chlamydosporia 170 TaxID=1380566 RepID=A0A179FJA3_METCM|nr:CMGC/DYRK protein kinase [Pochonia chlamydosporia 170]OAQ65341.1 CMGC/DYRK protein kinase [Pochonia chlamydosporia 170]
MVQISDFGLSVSGKTQQTGCIQAEPYRAPEVILDAGYSYSADIWSLGVLIWELLEGKRLFNPIDEKNEGEYNESLHLAQLTKLLGPPPRAMLSSGRRTALFYKPNGDLKQPELVPDNFDLKNTVSSISGQEKDKFLEFARRMIKWDPEERSTAKELLKDPWLYEDFPSKE